MFGRVLATVFTFLVYLGINALYTPQAALISSKIAGQQFEDSDSSYLTAVYGLHMLNGIGLIISLGFLLILVAIWYKPVRKFLATLAIVGTVLTAVQPSSAWAFATNGSDKTEIRGIESGESAFLVPNFGKTSEQSQYTSETYLNRPDVKVPGKFIQIPHAKLGGSGGSSGLASAFGSDYYTSTATLIKVKRALYSRAWVQKGRGSNAVIDESFPCQTAGGHNITKIGVSIGVLIEDANAAKYLGNFGLQPLAGDPDDIQNIFASVRYARPLTEVMDQVEHPEIQALVCHEILKYTDPVTASASMQTILDNVKTTATEHLAKYGITLVFIGWADTWTFDEEVQFAINQKFIASQIGDKLDVLQRNAVVNALEGLGAGARKNSPSFLMIPEGIMNFLKPSAAAPPTVTTPASADK